MSASRISLRHYLLAFCIPVLLVGVLLLWNEVWYMRQESERMHAATLAQVAESIDMVKEQCDALAARTQAQSALIEALKTGDQAGFISRWIQAYQEMSEFSVSVAVYARGTQQVYLANGPLPYGAFEEGLNRMSASLAGLYSQLNRVTTPQSVTLYRQQDDPYSIAYLYALMDDNARPVGTLCVMVPSITIREIFYRFFNAKTATLTVLDAARKPLLVSPQQWPQLKQIKTLQGTGVMRLQDPDTVALRTVSPASQQSYFVCMSASDFYRRGTSQALIYPMIALCVLSAALLAMTIFRAHQRRLNAMSRQNDDLSDQLDKHAQLIRELVLRKLVDGSIRDENGLQYNLRCANLTLSKPVFFLAVFSFSPESDMDQAQRAAAAVCEAMENEQITYTCFTRFEYSQLILLANADRDENRAEVVRTAQRLMTLDGASCLKAGIGRAHHSLLKLNHALVEAMTAMNEQMNAQDGALYVFDPPAASGERFPQYVIEKSLIRESIRNGSQTMLESSVKKIFIHLACADQSEAVLRLLYYDMVNFCIALSEEFDSPLSDDAIAALSAFQSPAVLEERILEILTNLCSQTKERVTECLSAPKYHLLAYVQEHFRNPELSLSMISEETNLSHSYISKLFKDETGQTFISYVKELRFNYVRRELAETDRPVKDIITDSGYIDAASFTRSFRQLEGVTPGEYRLRMQTIRQKKPRESD